MSTTALERGCTQMLQPGLSRSLFRVLEGVRERRGTPGLENTSKKNH